MWTWWYSHYFLATKMIMAISFTSQIYTYVLLKYTHVLAVYQRVQVVLMLQAEALGKDKILKCSGCQALSTKIYRAFMSAQYGVESNFMSHQSEHGR